jgi:hypothetical protein
LARIEFWAETLFGFFAAFFGDLEKQENKEEKHAEDSQEAEGLVVGDAAAEDGFEVFAEEEGFVKAVEHA